ncbi:hypothetical protein ACJX0J_014001 [Zea mays]
MLVALEGLMLQPHQSHFTLPCHFLSLNQRKTLILWGIYAFQINQYGELQVAISNFYFSIIAIHILNGLCFIFHNHLPPLSLAVHTDILIIVGITKTINDQSYHYLFNNPILFFSFNLMDYLMALHYPL